MTNTSVTLRYAVAIITALETVIVLFMFWIVLSGGGLSSSEELSRKISKALLVVYGVPYVVLVVPAAVDGSAQPMAAGGPCAVHDRRGVAMIFAKSWA